MFIQETLVLGESQGPVGAIFTYLVLAAVLG